jgi:peptide/nickel transport system ATP-binding protein
MAQYPHELSGGTNQRVALAIALAGRPDLLIADEPTTALDVTVQAQVLDLLDELRRELAMSLVLITHDLGVVSQVCHRVAVMYAGNIVETAPASGFWQGATHPYSRSLLASAPDIDDPIETLSVIPGQVPHPSDVLDGCAFRTRCPVSRDECVTKTPVIEAIGPGQHVACFAAEPARADPLRVSQRGQHA